jgi:hypothetical protein
MNSRMFLTLLFLTLAAYGKDAPRFQSATLLQMDSVECGYDEKSGETLAGQVLGTDAAHKKTHALLCQEYLLQSDRVIYRIRPKDEKHPVLLPVGEKAQFRIEKDKMKLRVEDLDSKERDYFGVHDSTRSNTRLQYG